MSKEKPPIDRAGAQDVPLPAPTPGEGPLPMPPGAGQPTPTAPVLPTMFVTFVGVNKKGKQVAGRAFIEGLWMMNQKVHVLSAEALIADNRGFRDVEITGWHLLDC